MEYILAIAMVLGCAGYICLKLSNDETELLKKQDEMVFLAIREQREEEREQRVAHALQNIRYEEKAFYTQLSDLFTSSKSVDEVYIELRRCYNSANNSNIILASDEPTQRKDDIVKKMSDISTIIGEFAETLNATDYPVMFDNVNYGSVNKSYWNEVRKLDGETVKETLDEYCRWINSINYMMFSNIDPILLPKFAWFYATEKPYSAENFRKACRAFASIYKGFFTDVTIAEFYAIKQMGGNDVLKDRVRDMLKNTSHSTEELTTIASGLMWMNAYQEESMILQHLLSTGQQMSEKAQNRLHALSNGGGKAPTGFDVESSDKELYFDVSSLSWKDEEYTGLFENLTFQDKSLSYSLAVRDEDKELMISQGLSLPDKEYIAEKLNLALAEEYGGAAKADLVRGVALSGSGEEIIEGILVETKECKQMSILVHVARIGKKLSIKFYTLFMPMGDNLADQKQQVLSLFKKLSPSVTMWESSIKDTVLMTIQQILNTSSQSVNQVYNTENNDGLFF